MEKFEEGKGFSRRKYIKLSGNDDDFAKHMRDPMERQEKAAPWRVTRNADGSIHYHGGTLDDIIKTTRAQAKEYLESVGLPSCVGMYKWPDGAWREERPSDDELYGWCSLEEYLKALGHVKDSFPNLAARKLAHCDYIQHCIALGRTQEAVREGILLGEALILWNVYLKTEGSAGGSAKQNNRAKSFGFESHDAMKAWALEEWDRIRAAHPYKVEAIDCMVAETVTRNAKGKVTLKTSTVTSWRRARNKAAKKA